MRALSGHELLVESRGHTRELCGGVAFGALRRVDDPGEARQDEKTARRDHRTGAQCRGGRKSCRVVRRHEDRDSFRDAPAAFRRGRIAGRAAARDRDRSAKCRADRVR